MENSTFVIYWAGSLFNHKELLGNMMLAEAVEKVSNGRFTIRLPQDISEEASKSIVDIRNADLRELIQCDAIVANFDGADLDSGTVVEFCVAKALDMPTVLLRTDFRNGGECSDIPWNLMCAGWPRTETILINALADYQCHAMNRNDFQTVMEKWCSEMAEKVMQALFKVCATPSWLSAAVAMDHFHRTIQSVGGGLEKVLTDETLAMLIEQKRQKGLLK